ncbi:hypothetical protein GQ44DRAFT_710175 [Phaeosphaeriaceae sp. PMI808]|nr:hypothetical protein GQ44DRAFT_710175 [Phaeosphaeriaceae sp. PMI808]
MTVPKQKVYQYVMTGEECQLINLLRKAENRCMDLLIQNDDLKLKQTFKLALGFGGQNIRHFETDATQPIYQSVRNVAQYLLDFLNEDQTVEGLGHAIGTITVEKNVTTGISTESPDHDSVIERHIVRNEPISQQSNPGSGSLDPVVLGHSTPENPISDSLETKTRPLGIKTMTIELDEDELLGDPGAETRIRNDYPWAVLKARAKPDICRESNNCSTRDLMAVSEAQPVFTSDVSCAKAAHSDTQNSMVVKPSEATATVVNAAIKPSSIASEPSHSELDIGSTRVVAANHNDQDNSRSTSPNGLRPPNSISLGTSPTQLQISKFTDSIGLRLCNDNVTEVQKLYTTLLITSEVRSFAPRSTTLADYYTNLVTLYILLHKQDLHDLAYIVLLRFQNTNQNRINSLPEIELAVRAFEHLPADSSLCRWFAILYSFLWGTQDNGEYNEFTENHSNLEVRALSKLLHAVAWFRDPFTKGHDAAVLSRWCDVHKHTEGSPEQQRCKQMRKGLKMNDERAASMEEARLLATKKKKRKLESQVASKPNREVESLPTRPQKKKKETLAK